MAFCRCRDFVDMSIEQFIYIYMIHSANIYIYKNLYISKSIYIIIMNESFRFLPNFGIDKY